MDIFGAFIVNNESLLFDEILTMVWVNMNT